MSTLQLNAISGGSVSLVGSDTSLALTISVPNTNGIMTLNTSTTGAYGLPAGTTAQRPANPVTGSFRLNTNSSLPEFYLGTLWISF
jgi:hypothetical protein